MKRLGKLEEITDERTLIGKASQVVSDKYFVMRKIS